MSIPKPNFTPQANPQSIIEIPHYRYTLLTERLIRIETSPTHQFQDHPTQTIWHRNLPTPTFTHTLENNTLTIDTPHLHLIQKINPQNPTRPNITITLKQTNHTFTYDQGLNNTLHNQTNLRGTARTLDNKTGPIPLEEGLLAKTGWTILNDSHTLIFDQTGWLTPRDTPPENLDLYFFGYAQDYTACLQDYLKLTGPVPLLPRWALGNWWSRYWPYTQQELLTLMQSFQTHQVPLTVCIIDMDWHITQTNNQSTGWTGYTWNPTLFPDPDQFLSELKTTLGLRTALNLHPAEGVHPHEQAYPEFAKQMDIDPNTQTPIPFNITDKTFTQAYFTLLHHPLEKQGIDFWWLDWQQGTQTDLQNLDPLYWLNHLHFYDLARDGQKRPFIFSRWGGLGSHRHPIGFSGDATVTWQSLAFQPHFTATAANVAYSWWSHDIGGHMGGIEEPELYTRWVQFGVFSPILRLHSTNLKFHERRPFAYDPTTAQITSNAMRLRHALIPYLYTMAHLNHTQGLALVRPMYHTHPHNPFAYQAPQQYTFGTELLAAPFTSKKHPQTDLTRQPIWFPQGTWFNFFTGEPLHSPGGWHVTYGDLTQTPIYAKAGAIIPLDHDTSWGLRNTPEHLTFKIFPGASNEFNLYEDDGLTNAYLDGASALTPITQVWTAATESTPEQTTLTIHPAQGHTQLLPHQRTFTLQLHALNAPAQLTLSQNGAPIPSPTSAYDPTTHLLTLTIVATPQDTTTLTLQAPAGQPLIAAPTPKIDQLDWLLQHLRFDTWKKQLIHDRFTDLDTDPSLIAHIRDFLTFPQLLALLELKTDFFPFKPDDDPEQALLFLAKQIGLL